MMKLYYYYYLGTVKLNEKNTQNDQIDNNDISHSNILNVIPQISIGEI